MNQGPKLMSNMMAQGNGQINNYQNITSSANN